MTETSTVNKALLKKFLVYAPDHQEEGTLARRYEVRETHLAEIKGLIDAGIVQVGGMFTDPNVETKAGQSPKALGSILIMKAETLEEVRKRMTSDIYYTSGVWDKETFAIFPFLPATPFPP